MDRKDFVKVLADVAKIAAGVAVGMMAYNWAAPRLARINTSKPLDVQVE